MTPTNDSFQLDLPRYKYQLLFIGRAALIPNISFLDPLVLSGKER